LIPGDVNEYDLRTAAATAHIPWLDWLRMGVADRAMVIAHWRIGRLLDLKDAIDRNNAIKAMK